MPRQRLNGLLLLGLLISFLKASANPVAKNVREYKALCHILRIAEGGHKMDTEDKAAKLIDWNNATKIKGSLKAVKEKVEKATTFPFNLTDTVTGENTPVTQAGAKAMLKVLNAAEPRVGRLVKILESKKAAVKAELEKAKKAFEEAIVGDETGDLAMYDKEFKLKKGDSARATTSHNREVVCASTKSTIAGDGGEGGFSLRTDLMCICAPGALHTAQICGFNIAGGNYWVTRTLTGLTAYWTAIYQQCKKEKFEVEVTPEEIVKALNVFQSLIGGGQAEVANHASITNANAIFGHMHSATTSETMSCTGVVPAKGVGPCVDYTGAEGTDPVRWRTKMIEAKKALAVASEAALNARSLVGRLETLLHDVLEATPQEENAVDASDASSSEKPSGKKEANQTPLGTAPPTSSQAAEANQAITAIRPGLQIPWLTPLLLA